MKNTTPHNGTKAQVISRTAIPVLTEVYENGLKHNLGQLLEFRKHPALSNFIPDQARLSVSWVNLKKGEVLDTHQHPTSSMIIICEGEGQVVGDCSQKIKAGDVVIVPPDSAHGFVGKGLDGFWALSIQWEGLGLYENPEKPRVKFIDSKQTQRNCLDLLLDDQKIFEKKFTKNPLMILAVSKKLENPDVKERLLEALNYWSDWFQKILSARYAMGGKAQFFDIAGQHLSEEVGHNKILYGMRNNKPVTFWDPLLDSAASWFYSQMLSGTDEEKTILVHFVLEGASTQFHALAKPLFPKSDHFEVHSTLDEDHFAMGCDLIRRASPGEYEQLSTALSHGWAVFNVIASQMARYAVEGCDKKREERVQRVRKNNTL